MKLKKLFLFSIVALFFQTTLYAKDLKFEDTYSQQNFKDLTKELGAALSFNPITPAESLGITGFDIGVEVSATKIDNKKEHWTKVFQNDAPSIIPVPRIHIQKGLPWGIDVGVMYSKVPSSNITLFGFELKYAVLQGDTILPAIAVRGAYSKLGGVEDLDLSTMQADLMISKGFLMFTPYAGVSAIKISAEEKVDFLSLEKEDQTVTKTFVGLQVSPMPLLNITVETSFGEVTQYGLKFGFRF